MTISTLQLSLLAIPAAALLSAGMTRAILPLLLKHALAKPNARSSHRIPTPQGGGIAVIGATVVVAGAIMASAVAPDLRLPVALFAATLFIAAVGLADDVNSIPVLPRLVLQGLAVATILYAAPDDLRIVPAWRLDVAGGPLVCESRQLHGWAGPDDGR